jgi:hypothetical protein
MNTSAIFTNCKVEGCGADRLKPVLMYYEVIGTNSEERRSVRSACQTVCTTDTNFIGSRMDI